MLDGNFNKSVALAKSYYENKNFGKYNLLFHNCADYTNELLDVANIDEMWSQILSEGNILITIPAVREFELSVSDAIDSGIKWASDDLVDMENLMIGSNIVGYFVGNALVGTGEFIDTTMNFVGDVAGAVVGIADALVDEAKKVVAGVTSAIYEAGSTIWNRLFS